MPHLPIRLAGTTLSILLFVATPSGAALFTGPVDTTVAGNPVDLTSGDLDGDGDPDLVVCHGNESLVTVLLNDGAGAFAQAPGGPLPGVPFPISAAPGSFNEDQDGSLDLVVVGGAGTDTAFIFLGDGGGGFHLAGSFPIGVAGGIGRKVAVVDSDGDGHDDLAFASGSVRLGHGDGTFEPAASLPLTSTAFDVIAADFDGDGRRDLAFMSAVIDNLLHVFIRIAAGGFAEVAGSPVPIPGEPETLAAGDLDGDGDLDLAVTDIFGMGAHVLINEGGRPTTLPAFHAVRAGYPRGIASADFDADGRADLAIGSNNSDDLSILLSSAAGPTEIEESPLHVTVGVPISMVAEDLNGDGAPDLAAVDFQGGRVAVFVNARAPVLEVPIDIQPGSDANVINVGSMGVVTVAILSTGGFDATSVDPATVLLAGAPVRPTPSGAQECREEAAGPDERVDLVCKVETEALQLGAGDTVATLTALTFDGTPVRGQDRVRVLAH